MWEAFMLLRQIASVAPGLAIGRRAPQPTLPADMIKDAIRLNFEGYRLSLPIASPKIKTDDRKIA
ncbi:hypothetical protein FJ987_01450 [Mesorhizobium sp. CU2]|nr:hypothetical protein FJ988_05535 [Mesorhizobium sp. CU3]TPO21507.1 hypothetical protein FJ987_01450 [Mesorhizobium sp. CU2]